MNVELKTEEVVVKTETKDIGLEGRTRHYGATVSARFMAPGEANVKFGYLSGDATAQIIHAEDAAELSGFFMGLAVMLRQQTQAEEPEAVSLEPLTHFPTY